MNRYFEATARRLDSEDSLDVAQRKEKDLEEDMLRRDTLESNHHSSRKYEGYKVVKKMDQDDSFTGLWIVESTEPLPPELSGSWTDVTEATKAIQRYLESRKETKDD